MHHNFLVVYLYILYIKDIQMRKLIDIPETILIDLKVMAAKANLSLKAFIENLLQSTVDNNKKTN